MQRFFAGSVGGLAASVAMTAALEALRPLLPYRQRYAHDPRLITGRIARETGLRKHLGKPATFALAWTAHAAYGTVFGGLFGWLLDDESHKDRRVGATAGVVYGLLVWAMSYAGWLPAAGIMLPPHRRTFGRNLLIIAGHMVWGLSLGLLCGRWIDSSAAQGRQKEKSSPERRSPSAMPAGT